MQLFNGFVTATLFKHPDINTLLHVQPNSRPVAQQLAKANRHVRCHAALFVQEFRHRHARNAQIVCEFFLRQAQRWQHVLTQNLAWMGGPALKAPYSRILSAWLLVDYC